MLWYRCNPTSEQTNRRIICSLTNVSTKCCAKCTEKNYTGAMYATKASKIISRTTNYMHAARMFICPFVFVFISFAICQLAVRAYIFRNGEYQESVVRCCFHFHNSSFTSLNPVAHQNHNHCVECQQTIINLVLLEWGDMAKCLYG